MKFPLINILKLIQKDVDMECLDIKVKMWSASTYTRVLVCYSEVMVLQSVKSAFTNNNHGISA
jgi:hypothetical protein